MSLSLGNIHVFSNEGPVSAYLQLALKWFRGKKKSMDKWMKGKKGREGRKREEGKKEENHKQMGQNVNN